MGFINRYTKSDFFNYYYSEEFNEGSNPIIFAVGKTESSGLITKLDSQGNIIWERLLDFEKGLTATVKKIIRIHNFGNDRIQPIFVAHVIVGEFHVLYAFDSEGKSKWVKQLEWKERDVELLLVPSMSTISFYVCVSDKENTELLKDPQVFNFDYNCSLISASTLPYDIPIVVKTMDVKEKCVVVAGHIKKEKPKGIVIKLSTDLKVTSVLAISEPDISIQDLKCIDENRYVISGFSFKDDKLITSIVTVASDSFLYKVIPDSIDYVSKVCLAGNIFFLSQYQNLRGIVHKFDFQLNKSWTKTLVFPLDGDNGIQTLNYRNNKLTFSCFDTSEGSLVAHCDLSLNTCKTATLEIPKPKDGELTIKLEHFKEVKTDIKLTDPKPVSSTISSSLKNLCMSYDDDGTIKLLDNVSLQSPNFILDAAGSKGNDGSASGAHLRWFMGGALADKHLPKGDYYNGDNFIFNKSDDFVRIYRAPYTQIVTYLNFNTAPNTVNSVQKFWVYNIQSKLFYIYFRDAQKYNVAASLYDPFTQTIQFIEKYEDGLLEIESKRDLFFAATPTVDNPVGSSKIKTETLSVQENLQTAPKITSSRKTYEGLDVESIAFVCDNGRRIRYSAQDCFISAIKFEFYSDFIADANEHQRWSHMGQYALSLDDSIVLQQLEPELDLIHGKWPRFNDGECVNIQNYTDRWNGPVSGLDRNISTVVGGFLHLSTDINNPNPTAIESVSFDLNLDPDENGNPPVPSEDDYTNISLLDVLKVSSNDYHIARMLGLGTLDTDPALQTGDKYVYLSEYVTYGDLEDGLGAREVQHLSMSLPTSIYDERLPLPVDILEITTGVVMNNNGEDEESISLFETNGYTPDGKYRFVSLIADTLPDDQVNKNFYWIDTEFNASAYSYPVYAGIEYRKNDEQDWVKPELSSDVYYQNIFEGDIGSNETIPILLPEDNNVLYVHKQGESGTHYYGSYGINIFSRATDSDFVREIETVIVPANTLQPPSNVNALLIRDEAPLFLTSEEEQLRKEAISVQDKTLVRLTFDYNSVQELSSYQIETKYENISDTTIEQLEINNEPTPIYPDDKEIFAEEIHVFFRNEVPNIVSGKIISITNDSDNTNDLLCIFQSAPYLQPSTVTNIVPSIPADKIANYIGGNLIMGEHQYVINSIDISGTYPKFTVFKKEVSDALLTVDSNGTEIETGSDLPQIVGDGLFTVIENMQNVESWNNAYNAPASNNPSDLRVTIGIPNPSDWKLNREVLRLTNEEGVTERILEKSRGIWQNATIEEVLEPVSVIELPDGTLEYTNGFNGLYKVTFNGYTLQQHVQYSQTGNSVEWFKGSLRLRTESSFATSGERRVLEVQRIENIGSGDLILYIFDNNYPGYDAQQEELDDYDRIQTGVQRVNYYPGYKVYLYTESDINLTESMILPEVGEGVKYSIFGLRSQDNDGEQYHSRFSIPALMFAQEIAAPKVPQQPLGAKYATRPDFFGKSTYSFTTSFGEGENSNHRPHAVLFLRTNEESVLNALYKAQTVETIKESLKILGGNDEVWLQNRWNDFFNFDELRSTGSYSVFPPELSEGHENGFAFPMPDNDKFIAGINDFIAWHNANNGNNPNADNVQAILSLSQVVIPVTSGVQQNVLIIDFVEQTIKNCFVPLTELPVIYQYIKDEEPKSRKQNVRDRNGYMLNPDDPEFEMAPMAKRVSSSNNKVLFTDFTLDGTSKNIYFYSVKEMSNQMEMGGYSPFLGPIKLVNTNAPEAPEIKRIMPILENRALGVTSSVSFEINSYPKVQHIQKINLYRSTNRLDAQSIRTMDLIKTIDITESGLDNSNIWTFKDDFSGLPEVPFGDPLFYRITVSRKVEYTDDGVTSIIEYAPSLPSKITATTIVEAYSPESPVMQYYSEPLGVNEENLNFITLSWDKTAYKGKYHLYKMNTQGNWVKIHEVTSNEDTIYVQLEDTELSNPSLRILSEDNTRMYHHFKVIAENTSGMLSSKENILTIYNEVTWNDVGGIGTMVVGGTFRVR